MEQPDPRAITVDGVSTTEQALGVARHLRFPVAPVGSVLLRPWPCAGRSVQHVGQSGRQISGPTDDLPKTVKVGAAGPHVSSCDHRLDPVLGHGLHAWQVSGVREQLAGSGPAVDRHCELVGEGWYLVCGLLNRNCRVHGSANLYLGGCSVFATPGTPSRSTWPPHSRATSSPETVPFVVVSMLHDS